MENALVRLIGWPATVLHGDPCVYDRWRWLRRHLLPGGLRTLDAGCGSGAFTMYAASIGNEALGICFNERDIRVARLRAQLLRLADSSFIYADLRNLDRIAESLGSFDQIICLETIEHIKDDRKLVADLSRLLRPGGRLLLTTPSKNYRRLFGDKVSQSEDGGHVRWGYTHDEIRQLFIECDLDVCIQEYITGVVPQQITNLMRMLSRPSPRLAWAATFPLRLLQLFDSPLTQLTRYPFLSLGVVGVRRDARNVERSLSGFDQLAS